MNDECLLKELIRLFLTDAPERITLLRRAIAQKEPETVLVISHGLRGASRSMTAERLGDLCNSLEEMSESGRIDGAEELVGEVEKEFGRLQDYLSSVELQTPRQQTCNDLF